MEPAIILVFILGYSAIAMEHIIRINKAASALFAGVVCWTLYISFTHDKTEVNSQLLEHLGDISGILFFLLGAMTIVEIIDAHNGFDIIVEKITTLDKRKLLWSVSFITFFLSAALDNLTTTIVMVSLARKLVDDRNDRLFFIGTIVVAANAGGAWSPIGDVTTTMLWIGNQVTTYSIMAKLILPSLACLLAPLLVLNFTLKGKVSQKEQVAQPVTPRQEREKKIVFIIGIGSLLFVPVFKTVTHLPPFMGMLMSLAIVWITTEIIHYEKDTEDKDFQSVVYALRKIDTPSILFFLGILISVSALQATGQLTHLASWLDIHLRSESLIAISIGLLSAIVDNVPLVAAAQGMYSINTYPPDHFLWEFLAYCTGTGGSVLIIGSAAGVAAMGIEKVNFFWYVKKITIWALIGYFAGAVVYILQDTFVG